MQLCTPHLGNGFLGDKSAKCVEESLGRSGTAVIVSLVTKTDGRGHRGDRHS
jgi:hypothetical protein